MNKPDVSHFPYIEEVVQKYISINTSYKRAQKHIAEKLKIMRKDKNRIMIDFDPEKGFMHKKLARRCKKIEADKTIPSWGSFRRNK